MRVGPRSARGRPCQCVAQKQVQQPAGGMWPSGAGCRSKPSVRAGVSWSGHGCRPGGLWTPRGQDSFQGVPLLVSTQGTKLLAVIFLVPSHCLPPLPCLHSPHNTVAFAKHLLCVHGAAEALKEPSPGLLLVPRGGTDSLELLAQKAWVPAE